MDDDKFSYCEAYNDDDIKSDDNDGDIADEETHAAFYNVASQIHASIIGHVSEKALTICEYLTINDVADILENIEK